MNTKMVEEKKTHASEALRREFYPKKKSEQIKNYSNVTSNISRDAKRRVARVFSLSFSLISFARCSIFVSLLFSFWIFFYENQDTRLIHSARSRKGKIWMFYFSSRFEQYHAQRVCHRLYDQRHASNIT